MGEIVNSPIGGNHNITKLLYCDIGFNGRGTNNDLLTDLLLSN